MFPDFFARRGGGGGLQAVWGLSGILVGLKIALGVKPFLVKFFGVGNFGRDFCFDLFYVENNGLFRLRSGPLGYFFLGGGWEDPALAQ